MFTGGGSEGDNLAIKGAAWALRERDPELDGIVTTGIEHKAVLGACARLEREGFRVIRVAARRPTASSTSTRSRPRSTSGPRSCR